MIRLHETIRVNRTRGDCYRYLADFSTCEQWDPGVYRAAKTTPGAPGPGTRFTVTVRWLAGRTTLDYELVDLKVDRRIELHGTGAGLDTREVIAFDDNPDGSTTIDYRADFTLGKALRVAAPGSRLILRRMARRAVRGLARALEIDPRPPHQGWFSYAADRSVVAAAPAFTERGYLAMEDKAHSQFMDDRTIAVTGATGGIGLAVACEYARLGATLLLVGRDTARLGQARQRIADFADGTPDRIHLYEADLLDASQTRAAAERIAAEHPRLDVLVNNAGALFDSHALTDDGFERSVAINLVAPFVLTEGLMTPLVAAHGRVVNMSSGGMYLQPLVVEDMNFESGEYSGTKAYARAKRGLVALTRHWARRYAETGVRFNAMHPGWVATAGVTEALPGFDKVMHRLLRDARMGADTAVWLGASAAAETCQGQFFLDRTPHPTAVVPGTQVKPSQAQALYAWLRNQTGIRVHGVG
ncbi:SDR family NAD(P)-dependent oxidoreductase [Salinisphaera sp. T31B1]|uniref:SDR family NAD(P)-dependent oxidoreductase n=1 Tax=Salinisphaera sp. T31B1 TaxID=727963 RepID=UPI0033407038